MKFRCRSKKKWKISSSSGRKTNAMRSVYAATTAVNDWWIKSILYNWVGMQMRPFRLFVWENPNRLGCGQGNTKIALINVDIRIGHAASKDTTTLSWPFPWIEESCLLSSIDIFGRKQMLLFCWIGDHCCCAMCALDFFPSFYYLCSVHCSNEISFLFSSSFSSFWHSNGFTRQTCRVTTTAAHNLRSALSSFMSPKNE